jgi:tetratricopeptide (TPR) repeat protein
MRAFLAVCTLGLAALFVDARTVNADLQKKLDEIVERYDKVQNDYQKALRDADKAERAKLAENQPGEEFIDEFAKLATEAKGTEVAAKGWMKVAEIALDFGRKDDAVKALDTLIADHVKSPELETLPDMITGGLGRFMGKEKTEATLRLLAEKSPHKSIQAASLYAVASSILREKKASPERTAEARKLMELIQKDYADVKNQRKQAYGALAEATLFEIDHLQIGKAAPDFEVTDENGVKFKLSDYKGKVVVIDFWGNW